jgi:D-arabinose 1-dehydrogenase-like Zn-dependent alcohol dehydrogenase
VHACGVRGTDREFVHGGFANMTWPLTPGHEIAGTIAELGDGVEGFSVGDRVAVGWFGGTAADIEETMNFAVLNGIRAQVQERPLEQGPDAYAAMENGHARYRMVLTTGEAASALDSLEDVQIGNIGS